MLVLILLPLVASCSFFDSELVSSCEEIIKDRLKSPSSYKRIKVSEYEKDITLEEYKKIREKSGTPTGMETDRMFQRGDIKPKELTAYIDYDADNSYGAAIRDTAECKIAPSGRNDYVSKFSVLFNGETELQYMKRSLDALE